MKGRTSLGVLLAVVGVLLALKILGISLGAVMGWLVPLLLIGLGWIGLRNGSKLLGGGLMAIGALIVLGKLSTLVWLLLAIGLVVWGVSMMGRKRIV